MKESQQKTLTEYSDSFEYNVLVYKILQSCRITIEKMEEKGKGVITKYWAVHKIKETQEDKYRGRIVNVKRIESERKVPRLEKALEICGADTLVKEGMLEVNKKKFDEFLEKRGIPQKNEFYISFPPSERFYTDILGVTQEITHPIIKELEEIQKELTKVEMPVDSLIAELQTKLEKPEESLLKKLEESLKALGKK